MNLYEIDNAILNCVDMETGEIIDMGKLNALQMERAQKIENIGCWIKNLLSDAKALKEEKDNLAARQKVAENKAASLKEFLSKYLDGEKFKTAKVSISYRKSDSVDISANATVPEEFWIARYPANDNGTVVERLRPSWGVGWQYSSKATIPGINTKVDRNIFYKDYTEAKESGTMAKTKEQIIQNVKNDAVSFAVNIANDNSHGYSQRIRSLYEINIPKSFDCSSLALTAYYYAFLKNGLTEQARYLKENCSYTGNMLKMLNAGFEVVARNQTAHKQMIKGDLELADNNPNGSNSHVAMAIGKNDIVHARSSEGTKDTKDNSGNEIRTQPWYLYSHGWTHRLRFTGKGIDFSGLTNTTGSKPTAKPSTSTKPSTTTSKGAGYMFEPKLVKLGSEGTSVLLLQEILIARGFKGKNGKALSLSRKADANTIYALKQYQKSRNGVLSVDGECGKNTWKDLIAI